MNTTPSSRAAGGSDAGLPTASWARRFLALALDWVASTLVVLAIIGPDRYYDPGSPAGFLTLGVYVLQSSLLTWLNGGSFGKLATGLRVVPADGRFRAFNPLSLVLRQVMVALVVPPLVFRPDGRGLHDVLVGTATVKRSIFDAMLAKARGGR